MHAYTITPAQVSLKGSAKVITFACELIMLILFITLLSNAYTRLAYIYIFATAGH